MVRQSALRFYAALILGGVALAQDVERVGGPSPSSANPAPLAASSNGYIVKFVPGTPQNDRASAAS
jgi:hypothetical protein